MAKFRRYKFLETEELFTKEEKQDLEITESEILHFWKNEEESLLYLVKLGIIKNEMTCDSCLSRMSLVKFKRKQSLYRWVCKKPCSFTASITKNSFLSDFNIPFDKFLMILYKYIQGHEIQEISEAIITNRKTISNLLDHVRERILVKVIESAEKLGGVDEHGNKKIVEIDESVFFKRKYNRGRILNQQWFIAGIERGSRKCFIIPVPNRNAQTIVNVLKSFVHDNTIIMTDGWRAYKKALKDMNDTFEHHSVNHSLNFVDPQDRTVHTQNVEGLFSRTKGFLKSKRGASLEQRSYYIAQFIWTYKIEKSKRLSNLFLLLNDSFF